MPKVTQKTLTFPLAGVSRRAGYREQSRPYSAPWAYNVRGVGPVESRRRGGSRPGLSKHVANNFADVAALVPVSVVSGDDRFRELIVINDDSDISVIRGSAVSAPVAALLTDDDVAIITDDEVAIEFNASTGARQGIERGGRVLLAGSVLQSYDPASGVVESVIASHGVVPAGCPLVSLYRDRVFLAGVNHLWYASRQSDPEDWDFGADFNDSGRAVAGHLALAGGIGDKITAMIPLNDSRLIFATRNELWQLQGDPADGRLSRISEGVGILSSTAWARSPAGLTAFLSADGIYVMAGAGAPERWSEERIPRELRNLDPDSLTISMAWDSDGRGFHLFLTPAEGAGLHWWLDIDNRAMWPVAFGTDGLQPVAATALDMSGRVPGVVIAGRDGILRMFNSAATSDDGTPIKSQVIIGPVRLTSNDLDDAILSELHGMISGGESATVTWNVISGGNAEGVADRAKAESIKFQAGEAIDVDAYGTWTPERNLTARPRTRGPWASLWLSSVTPWAFEAVGMRIHQLGRFRHGH